MKPGSTDAVRVIKTLAKQYPGKGDMDLGCAEDTILGVLLSARTTDKQVLKAFPGFRKEFPHWKALVKADPEEIGRTISTIGLYKSKARHIKGLAQKILTEFKGVVPSTMKELVTLPGVGRKTASCVLSYVFNIPAIAVDTHVFRIVRRLGWTSKRTPEKVERDLRALVPESSWNDINRTMVRFGRDICKAGTPQCWRCPVAKWCAYTPKTPAPKKV